MRSRAAAGRVSGKEGVPRWTRTEGVAGTKAEPLQMLSDVGVLVVSSPTVVLVHADAV